MNSLIQKIILATDFSEASKDAVVYAKWISGSLAAELKVLHVFEPGGWMVPSPYAVNALLAVAKSSSE